jgi:hypothetical protein
MHDSAVLRDAALDIKIGCGDALQQVLEEEHVEGLGEDGTRGARAWVGG